MPSFVRKRRTREHIIADLSINHVERCILRGGYSVERIEHDYGTDLIIFTYDSSGEIENGQIYMQVKATDTPRILADHKTLSYPVSRADLAAWLREPMPYILVVYDAQADVAYWIYVQEAFEKRPDFSLERAPTTIALHIPLANIYTEESVRRFARFRDGVLRQIEGVIQHDS